MDKSQTTNSIYRIIYKSTLLIALSLGIGVGLGINTGVTIISAVLAALFLKIDSSTPILPITSSFLVSLFVYNIAGASGALFMYAISAFLILFMIRSKTIKENMSKPYVQASLMLGISITMTIMMTNIYFGIGASGINPNDMIKHYRSLGFHPNFRTLLYGTIAMVLTIITPRKFKKGGKIISSAFLGLLAAYLLNFALIPSKFPDFIPMLNKAKISLVLSYNPADVNSYKSVAVIIISAFAFALITCMASSENEKPLYNSVYTLLSGKFGYVIPGSVCIEKNNLIEGIISAVIISIIMLITHGAERMPLSACAVILIVLCWQNIKWGYIPQSFKNYKHIISFFIILLTTVLITPAIGIIGAFTASLIIEKNE